uniref:NADH-ubiquinone oxidoreductase chain 2 n=1 Tax=Staphylinidae sp. BMNH 1274232 TaxID=1796565 RepID=A0A126TEP5_9COLE|nr:NADH dehydrogenase subunit 2 [Staphylinidae sp. BMNH 1274232]
MLFFLIYFYYKILFFITLIMGSFISISSNSTMGMWIGLEINLLSFIPLIQEKNNQYSSESSLKYFLTQALASTILLFSLIFMTKNLMIMKNIDNSIMIIFNSALLTKMGMAPFHFWFPEVIEGLNWLNCLILLTWQKITPMVLIMFNMNFQYFFLIIIVFSMMVSGFIGINQISLRKILAYSSINHMAWMISSMYFSETIWMTYFLIYSILSINIIAMFFMLNIYFYNQLIISLNNNMMWKFFFSFNFLSLSGLPPFLGFMPKWLTIQYLIQINWFLLAFFMVMLTLMTLFFYIRLIFNIMVISNNEINYLYQSKLKTSIMVIFNLITLKSLLLFNLTFNFF